MSIPLIRGTAAPLYPFTLTFSCKTEVSQTQNGEQQRWMVRQPLVRFELPFNNLTKANRDSARAAFAASKGQFDLIDQITLGGVTYSNLSYDSDAFSSTEARPGIYGAKVSLSQVAPQAYSFGAVTTVYPTFSNGTITQLPSSQAIRYKTEAVTVPTSGSKYTYAYYGSGLTNFSAVPPLNWKLSYPMMIDADVATLVAFFLGRFGRFKAFDFTDPDTGIGYTLGQTHFSNDDLVLNYIAPDVTSVSVDVEQIKT